MDSLPAIPAASEKRYGLLVLLCVGFVLTGIATVIIGPLLPLLITRWQLSDSQAGLFFTIQFASSLCGVWITTVLTSRRGYRPGLVIGYLLTGAGLVCLNASTHGMALTATALFGLGYGIVVPPTNLCAAEIGGKHSVGFVSLLNFIWGIGAVTCSPLILLAQRRHFLPTFLVAIACFGIVLAVFFLFVAFPSDKSARTADSASTTSTQPGLGVTVCVAALFFIYVGTETSLGGWAAETVKRLAGGAGGMSTVAPLFFYAGLVSGRGLATLLLLRIRALTVVLTCMGLGIVGTGIVIGASSEVTAMTGFAVAGLGCSSIYPIYIAWFSTWYGAAARRIGGVVFSMASLGGSAMPLLVGFLSTQSGSLRTGLLVPLAGYLGMLSGIALLHRQKLV